MVIAIIAILVAILMPALSRMRDAGRMTVCKTNLKALAFGAIMYAQDFDNRIPLWGIEFDEIPRFGSGNWTMPDNNQLEKSFEWGYLWDYANSKKSYVCPALNKDKHNPHTNPNHAAGQPVWGWPDPANPNKPDPIWSYSINGQAAVSMNAPQGRTNPDLVLPSPYDVFMLYEQDEDDMYAWDNSVSLFDSVHSDITSDSLGKYHGVVREAKFGQNVGRGNLVYFDGHVEDMSSEEYRYIRRATAAGTKQFCGGYLGFTWPGF